MKINVGGEYLINSKNLITFFDHTEENENGDILIYMGKFFLHTKSKINGERSYDDAYIFYSEKKKSLVYSVKRDSFVLDSEFNANINYVNFKENKIFVNNKSVKHFNKQGKNEKLHTIWMDEEDYLNNKDLISELYSEVA